jgi:hypothetical protein
MHVPASGGAPHPHDFEGTFILLEGEVEAIFRVKKSVVRERARLLCICSPAGQENFFMEVGTPVATRTTPTAKLDEKQQAEFMKKAKALALKYRTELLKQA